LFGVVKFPYQTTLQLLKLMSTILVTDKYDPFCLQIDRY